MYHYLLRPIKEYDVWFDKNDGIVVCANNEKQARIYASEVHGDEGKELWLDENMSSIYNLTKHPYEGVVLIDCHEA